jgi:putative two-component system response regulator
MDEKEAKILICDKRVSDRQMLSKILKGEGYFCSEAGGVLEILKSFETEMPDVILLDLSISADNDQAFLFQIRKRYPEILIIAVATISELDVAVQSVGQGVHDYLTRPLDPGEVIHCIKKAIMTFPQRKHESSHIHLEDKILCQSEEINEYFLGAMATLSYTLEAKDNDTAGHSRRVADISIAIGRKLNLSKEELEDLSRGSLLHDFAKITIDNNILKKNGKLSPAEYARILTHPILVCLASSLTNKRRVIEIIRYHRAHYNGEGLRQDLREQEIPLLARIVAIADAYDTLTSNHPCRKALSREEALIEIKKNVGIKFDPKIVEVFLKMSEDDSIEKREKVLIADDDEDIRLLVKSIMSNYYLVIEAANGQEAIEIAQNQKPDLILMDILMPEKDGYQALREIKKNLSTKEIPIVMLTAINQDLNKDLALNLGSNGYVTKPFTPQDLLDTIRKSINPNKDKHI